MSRPKLSGTARAIRLALALSTAALALSGAGSAFAQTCTPAVPPPGSTVTCSGAGNTPITYTVEDLTVITDATADVTTNGSSAVDLNGTTGGETLYNYGSLNTTGASTVAVNTTSGDILVENDYSVLAYGGTIAATVSGVYAGSYSGVIDVYNQAGAVIGGYNNYGTANGINVSSLDGDINVTNDGSVNATSGFGTTYGIYATSDNGIVTVTNNGDVTAYGGGISYGINAQSYYDTYVYNTGSVSATSTGNNSNAYGIFVYTCDCVALDATVDNSGTVTATTYGTGADAYGVHIYAYGAGDATVTNSGDIVVDAAGVGANATGIYITLDDGVASIDSSGSISVYGYSNVYGMNVQVDGYGSASVTNSGTIDVTAIGGYGTGVLATTAYDGSVYVGNSGSIDVASNLYGLGVHAYSDGAGTVTVDNSGTIAVTSYYGPATGIMTSSNAGDTLVDNSGDINVTTTNTYAPGIGINATGYTTATVYNTGDITVSATGAGSYAYGIMVISYTGDITVDSSGSIDVTGTTNVHGIDISGGVTGDVYVTTAGTIDATSTGTYGGAYGMQIGIYGGDGNIVVDNGADISVYDAGYGNATGIFAYAYYGYVAVDNTGDMYAHALYGNAYGVYAYTTFGGNISVANDGSITLNGGYDAYGVSTHTDGYTQVTNSGTIDVTSGSDNGYGILVEASGTGNAVIDNAGSISVSAYYNATGIDAYASASGTVDVSSSGTISVSSTYGIATGILANAYGANVSVDNSGSISATANGILTNAVGIDAYGYTDAYVSNDGDVTANAYGAGSTATGIYAVAGTGNASVVGTGSVDVYAVDDAIGIHATVLADGYVYVAGGAVTAGSYGGVAYGVLATTAGAGTVGVYMGGDITASGYGAATGIYAQSYTGAVSVYSSGDISTTASASGAETFGIKVESYDGDAYVGNVGSISGYSTGVAYGIYVQTDGNIDVESAGDISVDANSGAYGIHALANGGVVSVATGGDVSATTSFNDATGIYANAYAANAYVYAVGGAIDASAVYGNATGIHAAAYADVYVGSSDDITVYAGYGNGTGIFASAYAGNAVVHSTGAIDASSNGVAYGIHAVAYLDGYVSVSTGGTVLVTATAGTGYGIFATSNGLGDVSVDNGADVHVDGSIAAYGIKAYAAGTGSVSVDSTGDVYAAAASYDATGIFAGAYSGNVGVAQSGDTEVYAYLDAAGIEAHAYGLGDAYASNGGAMTVSDAYATAQGMVVLADGGGYATAVNTGSIDVSSSHGLGTGIIATSYGGYASVYDTGAVTVDSYYSALGIGAVGFYGAAVYNFGDIAVASSDYDAIGIQLFSRYGDLLVENAGAVSVHADGLAFGIDAYAENAGDVDIANDGDISVTSDADAAVGIYAHAFTGAVTIDDAGDIDASGYADATGIRVRTTGDVSVSVAGAVDASASAYAYAQAIGVALQGYDVYFDATGPISATASADADAGAAYAIGVDIEGTYVGAYVHAPIAASANGYYAFATGLEVNGSYGLSLGLYGDISATATGDFVGAYGLQASSYVDVLVYSTGDIDATANGSGYANAVAVSIASLAGDIFFYNGGNIVATGADQAVAVELYGGGSTLLINHGLVAAYADDDTGIAFRSGDADDTLLNYGTIHGRLLTAGGDDSLYNAPGASWDVYGMSDFGDGDDAIVNAGTIHMHDAVIDLGLPGASGNSFVNYDTITVSGAYNIIDMEGGSAGLLMGAALASGPSPLASTNPQPFYNEGLIDLRDGAPDDVLTIVGDFAGSGDIAVDVSGLHGTGDLLYIDGDVLSGTVQHIDVDMLDLPANGVAEVPVVEVSGNSVSGNFVLGSVDYTPIPFLTTSFSLVSHINTSSPDMFSVHVAMDVDRAGAIAADLPAGVQLLVNDVVGSWHKRVDGMDDRPGGKFSLWGRIYQSKGKVEPDFESDTITGGDFSFNQKNTGGEAGFDFAPNGKWNFGVILGRANANQDLRVGLGSDRIEGNVAGGYGTYRLPRGFYLDFSHRQLDFDAVVHTANGDLLASGKARTDNAESGYSFNFKGFQFEGQVQVTHTKLVSLDDLVPDGSNGYAPPTLAKMLAAPASTPAFDNDADLATTTRVGWDVRKKFKTQPGTLWELHATLNRIHMAGGNNAFQVTDAIGGRTDIGGDSSLLDVGFTARRGLLLFYGAATWQDGGALQNFFGLQLGAKYTW